MHQASQDVAALTDPELDPLFRLAPRRHVDSAWYGHVPFAHWVIGAARPAMLVELGTHAGVSYSAFCDAVLREHLDTRCFAVDTWQGDDHAGFYGEDIFTDLARHHDALYSGFSRMLRCTFDAALPYIPDGAVDLLHIDGRHGYEDVRHDFETWRPKLAPAATVLFHDTNVRERGFGVWRLWAELAAGHPHFEFLHAHGLGVLAIGAVPPAIAALCNLTEPALISRVRERFARLGEVGAMELQLAQAQDSNKALHTRLLEADTWIKSIEAQLRDARAAATDRHGLLVKLDAARADRDAAERQARQAAARHATAEASLALALEDRAEAKTLAGEARAAAAAIEARAEFAERALDAARHYAHEAGLLAAEKQTLLGSTSWRVTGPLRRIVHLGRPPHAERAIPPAPPLPDLPPPAPPLPALPVIEAPAPSAPAAGQRRILYAAGEPGTPGSLYRCTRYAEAATRLGWSARVMPFADIGFAELDGCDVVVLWRVAWDPHVQGIIDVCRQHAITLVFDVDDLMFKPKLADPEVIDGIRSLQFDEREVRAFFGRVHRTLKQADLCTCTTIELARHMRENQKAVHVLPNGYDDAAWAVSRLAVRRRSEALAHGNDLVRLGYAGGTRTHQKDFARCADAVARTLRERPQARLVLFRDPSYGSPLVMPEEFPALLAVKDQIEWRDMVSLADLPAEIARFDINLAPLEIGNPFCEAKSELKYFEAALVDVATVASPTAPFRRAIDDGRTGFLAEDEAQWTTHLLRLVDDPALRRRVGHAAYYDALWRFGPQRREETLAALFAQIDGGEAGAQAFELALRRGQAQAAPTPDVPASEILFASDGMRQAEVTVTIASYNYAEYVIEALESVRAQTLDLLDLVIVDDTSPDPAVIDLVTQWARTHAQRFNRLIVRRHVKNAGLGGTRNSGFDAAETPFILPLDTDNRLHREACATLLAALKPSRAAYAYPLIRQFGGADETLSDKPFEAARLVGGNYIDAMAMVAKWAWAAAGGYYVRHEAMGWEDYDLWCRLAELGQWGLRVDEHLADYRVHAASMVNAITERHETKRALVDLVEQRHPWLELISRTAKRR